MALRIKNALLEISKDPRKIFASLQIAVSIPFVIAHWILVILGLWRPPETLLAKFTLYFSVPLISLSLYITFYRKLFPQRIGDIIHTCALILIISTFGITYTGRIGGGFVFLFFFLIALSALLMDDFIPLFIAGLTSLIVIGENLFIMRFAPISYTPLAESFLQILAFLLIGWTSSNLVKRTLSEQKAKQRLQLAYEELKKLDIAKSEFISIASHQLRTPLSAIKGYLSMILEGSYGNLPEKVKKPMENVYQSNERLIKLVNDILSVSKIEAGEMEMNWEREDLREIIKEVISELSIKAKEKNLYLKFEEPKEFPKVLLDREKIRQVILNLVDNAIRYTQKGGVTVKLQIANGKWQIVVSDTGEGLTKEEKEKLFEMFSRGTAGTKFWTEGAGLGLYIARKFVEMHNGKIWAESEGKGKGSKFYVELPIK